MPITTKTYNNDRQSKNEKLFVNGVKVPISWIGTGSPGLLLKETKDVTSFRGNPEDDYAMLSGMDLRRNLRSEFVHRFDNGHEFTSVRTGVQQDPAVYDFSIVDNALPSRRYRYVGPMFYEQTSAFPAPNISLSLSEREAMGRYAISATAPTSPEAGLAQILGELREKLPQAVGFAHTKGASVPKKGSEEYLNFQFGLQPTANDLAEMAYAVTQFHKTVKQFRKSSDLPVRRSLKFATRTGSTDTVVTPSNGGILQMPRSTTYTNFKNSVGSASTSDVTKSTSYSIDSWFSGAFSYHLAEANDFLGKLESYEQLANHLLGTRITPELVWELTPWSWLIDWVSDAGVFFKNISLLTNDSLVLRYGYLMSHSKSHAMIRAKMNYRTGISGNFPTHLHYTSTVEKKTRIRSTPYGFGLDTSGFSAGKWAILGALGLTKGDRKLRYLD